MGKVRCLHALLLLLRGDARRPTWIQPDEAAARTWRVHDERYLDAVRPGPTPRPSNGASACPGVTRLLRRSRLAVRGTIDAPPARRSRRVSPATAGGTRHAFAGHGEGFCLLNDVAVAIRVLQAGREIAHALVVDLDVHQGNGTAAIFAGDASVFTFSMHGERNYPAVKQRSSLDVGLPDGVGDAAHLEALGMNHRRRSCGRSMPTWCSTLAERGRRLRRPLPAASRSATTAIRARDRYRRRRSARCQPPPCAGCWRRLRAERRAVSPDCNALAFEEAVARERRDAAALCAQRAGAAPGPECAGPARRNTAASSH